MEESEWISDRTEHIPMVSQRKEEDPENSSSKAEHGDKAHGKPLIDSVSKRNTSIQPCYPLKKDKVS